MMSVTAALTFRYGSITFESKHNLDKAEHDWECFCSCFRCRTSSGPDDRNTRSFVVYNACYPHPSISTTSCWSMWRLVRGNAKPTKGTNRGTQRPPALSRPTVRLRSPPRRRSLTASLLPGPQTVSRGLYVKPSEVCFRLLCGMESDARNEGFTERRPKFAP